MGHARSRSFRERVKVEKGTELGVVYRGEKKGQQKASPRVIAVKS